MYAHRAPCECSRIELSVDAVITAVLDRGAVFRDLFTFSGLAWLAQTPLLRSRFVGRRRIPGTMIARGCGNDTPMSLVGEEAKRHNTCSTKLERARVLPILARNTVPGATPGGLEARQSVFLMYGMIRSSGAGCRLARPGSCLSPTLGHD